MVDLRQSLIECLNTLGGQIRRVQDNGFKHWQDSEHCMVKPTDKEIFAFRRYLKKQGFTEDGLCKGVYYLYMKYGYVCVSIEYNKKGEFKEVSSFLSLGWEKPKCSRFYFPNYYNFGGVRKLDRDYVDKCTLASTNVMVAINDMLEKIASLLPRH